MRRLFVAVLLLGGLGPALAGAAGAALTREAIERLEKASDTAWEEVVRSLGAGQGTTLRGLRWDLWSLVTVLEREADRLLARARDDDRPPDIAWDLLRLERRIATLRWLAPRGRLDGKARDAVEALGKAADELVELHRPEVARLAAGRTRGFERPRLTRRERTRLLHAIERLGERAARLEKTAAPLVAGEGPGSGDETEEPAEDDPRAFPLVPLDDPRVFIAPNDDRWRAVRAADAAWQLLDFATLARGLAREAPELPADELTGRLLTLVRLQRAVVRTVDAAERDLPRDLLEDWQAARRALGEATRVIGVPLPVS